MPLLFTCLLLLTGIFTLIFLQNSRSLFIRTLGLFIIFGCIVGHYVLTEFDGKAIFVLAATATLGGLAFLSDLYSASLRTWFFRVSSTTSRVSTYGIMFGILLIPFIFRVNVVHGILYGTVLGALIGELRGPKQDRNATRVTKSSQGTVVGFYGMGTKILLGIMMADIFFKANFREVYFLMYRAF